MPANNAKLLHFHKKTHIGKRHKGIILNDKNQVLRQRSTMEEITFPFLSTSISCISAAPIQLQKSVTFSPPYIYRHCDDFQRRMCSSSHSLKSEVKFVHPVSPGGSVKFVASGVNFSIFTHFLCFFLLKLLTLGEIDGVKFLT